MIRKKNSYAFIYICRTRPNDITYKNYRPLYLSLNSKIFFLNQRENETKYKDVFFIFDIWKKVFVVVVVATTKKR
jgi:hypothetical protein